MLQSGETLEEQAKANDSFTSALEWYVYQGFIQLNVHVYNKGMEFNSN